MTTGKKSAPGGLGKRLLLILSGPVLAALLLLAVEGILTLAGAGDSRLYDDPFVGFEPGQELFSRQPGADGEEVWATNPGKLTFFNSQRFPVEKGEGTYRVFTLGGSTAAGRPYDDQVAFSRWMELYLSAMDPSRRTEVINAGAISYASYRVVVLIKELVRYEPDLFVIYTGHNEFLEERTYSDFIDEAAPIKRLRVWLGGFRFAALMRAAWHRDGGGETIQEGTRLAAEVTTKLEGWTGLERYRRDDELRASILEHFEFNLRRMIEIAGDHGVDVILIKAASNLKDFSPFKSEHRAGLAGAEKARFDRLLGEGRALLAGADPAAAIAGLREASAIDPVYAEARFLLGRALLAAGSYGEAEGELVAAKDLDVAPLRALEAIAELVAETARSEGVPLIDLPELLRSRNRERLGHPILGDEVFLDHVHPDAPVHSLIAEKAIEILVASGEVRPVSSWSGERRRALFEQAMAALDPVYYAERDLNLAKVLGWAGKFEEAEAPLRRAAAAVPANPETHHNLGIVLQRLGRYEEAAGELERALALGSETAETHFNVGVVYGELGRAAEGVRELERALDLRPAYPEAQFNLGLLKRRGGDLEGSVAALEKARSLQGESVEIDLALGLTYRRLERWEEAIAALRRAVELDPTSAEARTELGITYGRLRRFDEAETELQKAIEAAPAYAEARYNLAVLYAGQGRRLEARREYERTLEIDDRHLRALNNLGIQLATEGDLAAAEKLLRRAVGLDPGYAEAQVNLAVVYDGAGRPEEALAALVKAVELAPENPRFHFALASLYYARGRRPEARRHFEIALIGGQVVPPEILRELGLEG